MYSDIVMYALAVQHQKDLLQEVEHNRFARQRMAGEGMFGMVFLVPHKISDEFHKAWKNRNGKQRHGV